MFFNEKDELAEGSITNVFIEKDGIVYTTPLSTGILNGVYRNFYIQKNLKVTKKNLYLDDLKNADKIFLTNSVRREIYVTELIVKGQIISLGSS